MAAACQATFGAGSRIATTVEIVSATNFPATAGVAWVQPVLFAINATSTTDNLYADASGWVFRSPDPVVNCHGWTANTAPNFGLTVSGPNHSIGATSCTVVIPVACAAP